MVKKCIFTSLFFLALFNLALYGQEKKQALPLFEQPLLVTSAGQSADLQLASVLAKRAGLNFQLSKLATAKDLEKMKTLVLVLGASLKGLGEAGLDMEKEKERVKLLVEEAQIRNIPLLCLHLGGESRRGQLSDELASAFLPYAKMVILVESGNKGGFFTRICQEHNIPLIEVKKTAEAVTPFKEAFK